MFECCFCFDRSNCTFSLWWLKADGVTQMSNKWKVRVGQVYRLLFSVVKDFEPINWPAICAWMWNMNKSWKQHARGQSSAHGKWVHAALFQKEPDATCWHCRILTFCQTLFALHRWHVGKKLHSLWNRAESTFSKTYNSNISCFFNLGSVCWES